MKIIKREQASMANVYWKRPLVISHGSGANLYDSEGNEYIDCTSNYGVAIAGHCHPQVVKAIKEQSEKLLSCHGTFYNKARSQLLERMAGIAPEGLSRMFLSNSGTESVEFALKLARRATGKTGIIAMMGGFHGKTMGSLSATWKKKYKQPFMPLVSGFVHAPFGKIDRVEKLIDNDTAAVITEPIQGESGINVPPDDFLPTLRELCTERGILMITDEIQTGMGRTGKMFACQHWDYIPDVMCLSKAVASGLPLGVTLASEEIMSKLKMGDHSSTFGGGPIPAAAAVATIDVLTGENLPARAAENGAYLMKKLNELAEKYRILRNVRGMGLMIGLEFRYDILKILMGALERKVLVLDAGTNIIRLLPPLVIKRSQLDTVINVLNEVIGEEEAARTRS
jgi:acetylornithine/LysW-gamma-L-lysine aminotransferase